MMLNWRKWQTIQEQTKKVLCRGEEQQLTDDEVNQLNYMLTEINEKLNMVVCLFEKASERWAEKVDKL